MLPDVVVQIASAAAPAALTTPTSIAQQFEVMQTQRGSSTHPMLLQSMNDYLSACGARTATAAPVYDWADDFFGEQGRILYVSRYVSSTATQATVNLLDATSGVSLIASAGYRGDPDPGTWANGASGGLGVAVIQPATGVFQLQVYLAGALVETSPAFTTQADAIGWSLGVNPAFFSRYIVLSLGASANLPAVAGATNLAGGTDGSAVSTSDHQAALDRIAKELGSGQVGSVGATTSVLQLQVIAHAIANRRFAILDAPDTASDTTINTAAAALYAAPGNGRRWAQMFTPWDVIDGLTAFTSRTVAPTAAQAAAMQRVDSLGNPNQAAAGRFGTRQNVRDLSQPAFTDAQRLGLNSAGVTVSRRRFGGKIVTYGFRTLADPVNDANWSMAPNVRAVMWYAQRAAGIGANHFADQLDPFGHSLADFRAELMGAANELYQMGALFGATAADAFYVDTGPSVNTVQTQAQGQELASVKLKFSPAAEALTISIVKTPITQAL